MLHEWPCLERGIGEVARPAEEHPCNGLPDSSAVSLELEPAARRSQLLCNVAPDEAGPEKAGRGLDRSCSIRKRA